MSKLQQANELIDTFEPISVEGGIDQYLWDMDLSSSHISQYSTEVKQLALKLVDNTINHWENATPRRRSHMSHFGHGADYVERCRILEGALIDALQPVCC
jgi:hypothetical protein